MIARQKAKASRRPGATAAVNKVPTETSASTPNTIRSRLGGISMPSTELPATTPTENRAV